MRTADQRLMGRRRRAAMGLVIAATVWMIAAAAGADAVKLGGFWFDDVNVVGLDDGRVHYVDASGQDVYRPIGDVEAMRLTALPELARIEQRLALGGNAAAGAVRDLEALRDKAPQAWHKRWIEHRLTQLHAAKEAVPTPGPATAPGEALAAGSKGAAVVLPQAVPADDPITQLLVAGRFDEVLGQINEVLAAEPTNTALRLYQKGAAQLAVGLAANDEKHLKDAGLSFMRVVVHFGGSALAGPAMLEAGLVHQRIGRSDLARSLYDRAMVRLDPDDALLQQRAQELRRGLGEEQ